VFHPYQKQPLWVVFLVVERTLYYYTIILLYYYTIILLYYYSIIV